jgi:mRNA interferase RelE/StbE
LWRIEFDAKVDKEMARLAPKDRQRILRFLRERVAPLDNPRDLGEALAGALSGYWKYRVGDYRVIAKIENQRVTILVVRIGNRREVYR